MTDDDIDDIDDIDIFEKIYSRLGWILFFLVLNLFF